MYSTFPNIVSDINIFRQSGYVCDFELQDNELKCLQTKKSYPAVDVIMNKFKQFKLDREYNKRRLIFALECKDGLKGILDLETVGYNGMKLLTFMDKVKVKVKN